ncbi:MAG: hypothetical protein KGJ57_17330 [Sphingomonadales bacterium]|nr:hypothetical protein [Sphingomonadales bacterium]MDE2171160.1 hypothetical protein [Sphingomonadales bacterium]
MAGAVEEAAETALTAAAPPVGIVIKVWTFIRSNLVPILLGVLAIVLLVQFGLVQWRAHETAKTQDKVTANVSSATNASAADAITTVEHNITTEHNITNEVTHAQAAVSAASNAFAADAAGRDGLCGINAGFCPAAGVQQSGSR